MIFKLFGTQESMVIGHGASTGLQKPPLVSDISHSLLGGGDVFGQGRCARMTRITEIFI